MRFLLQGGAWPVLPSCKVAKLLVDFFGFEGAWEICELPATLALALV